MFGFKVSNNEVEYGALIIRLKLTNGMGIEWLQALSNSMLVIQQIKGEYEMKGENIAKYLIFLQALFIEFPSWNIDKIPRVENVEVDNSLNLM